MGAEAVRSVVTVMTVATVMTVVTVVTMEEAICMDATECNAVHRWNCLGPRSHPNLHLGIQLHR